MKEFANIELKLGKNVKAGDKESLLSLFRPAERFKPMEVLMDAEEDTTIKVIIEGLWEADHKLGNDVEKGKRKNIMTLFWYSERSRSFKTTRAAKAGDSVTIRMLVGS